MTLGDSLIVSLIGFSVVFIVLIVLSALIQFQSLVLGYVARSKFQETGKKHSRPRCRLQKKKLL